MKFLLILLLLSGCGRYKTKYYKMPNGVLCKYRKPEYGAVYFEACDDGIVYCNPPSYQEIR